MDRKTAVVTGAGEGIGRAVSVKLAKEGFHVYVTDMILDKAKETVALIEAEGNVATACEMNVLNEEQIAAVVDLVVKENGHLDVWCNNAGVSSMGRLWDMTEKDWDFNMDINAKGVFMCTKGFVKVMMEQKSGKIINIASIASLRADPMLSCYCASKWAVAGFTQTCARELGPFGITANAVCPGPVATSMNVRENDWSAAIQGITPEKAKQDLIDAIPLGRLTAPEDVANCVAFLAGQESNYINGAKITVTGGMEA